MIVEFVGLPGAGKTSLEAALVQQAKLVGLNLWSRRQLVEQLISECSRLPRDSIRVFRRASTALYKLKLLADCVVSEEIPRRAGDLVSRHRLRALARVAEDVRLYRADRTENTPVRCVNLSEGLCQHLAALGVWRVLLGRGATYEGPAPLVESMLIGCRVLVIHVDVPESVALDRLLVRGRPALWPDVCEPEAVISQFKQHISRVLDVLASHQGVSVIRVDGTLATMDWTPEARQILSIIERDVGAGKEESLTQSV